MDVKKITTIIIGILSSVSSWAAISFPDCKGVWAADDAEAVITDSVAIVYYRSDSTMQAVLEIPSIGLRHRTVFAPDGSVTTDSMPKPLEIAADGGRLIINGFALRKIEDVVTTAPYEMPKCGSANDVGRCLQAWNLGVKYSDSRETPACEINTNRHMFVYMVAPSMVYIRAAAARSNNHGTLFSQNIRMMKNHNTGEYTMMIYPGNYRFALNDLEIDNTKFHPDRCTFSPEGGIYWSLISFEPEMIKVNGCGETYHFGRTAIDDSEIKEWIKFAPYSDDITSFNL